MLTYSIQMHSTSGTNTIWTQCNLWTTHDDDEDNKGDESAHKILPQPIRFWKSVKVT